jgi:hypothetical protein
MHLIVLGINGRNANDLFEMESASWEEPISLVQLAAVWIEMFRSLPKNLVHISTVIWS